MIATTSKSRFGQLIWAAGLLLAGVARPAFADSFGHGDGHWGELVVDQPNTVINEYARVTTAVAIGARLVTLDDPLVFAPGDLVLVWQATGLSPASSADASGTPTDLAPTRVGRFELARVVSLGADHIVLRDALTQAFDPDVSQALYVPEFTQVTVQAGASIVPEPWDAVSHKGGIVAFFANATIVNNGLIDATGSGMLGGAFVDDGGGTGCTALDAAHPAGAQKGEGVADGSYGIMVSGRGHIANGAGGGVCRDAGGGGGGHGGRGGKGGRSSDGSRDVGGAGGTALTYPSLSSRLTLGGGGGAGHGNQDAGGDGGDGGGVIFIRGAALGGTGTLRANGSAGSAGDGDGAGGGGGGGSVLVETVGSAQCSVEAKGGAGGGNAASFGTGGGGGGGRVFVRSASGSCSATTTAGAPGMGSGGDSQLATAGGAGLTDSASGGLDVDADDDGVLDVFDGSGDRDGDGLANYLDDDDDGDGVPTVAEDAGDGGADKPGDSDGDLVADYLDDDDDDDTVLTLDEDPDGDLQPTNDDTDSDGIPNYLDDDDDGDTVATLAEDITDDGNARNDDTDLDGVPNFLDHDDDDDGLPTRLEDINGNGNSIDDDHDLDGRSDFLDDDDDNDAVPTKLEDPNNLGDPRNADSDADGHPDYRDDDDDDDRVPTAAEDVDGNGSPRDDDSDGDGIENYLDVDDDGDGLGTAIEDGDGDGDPRSDNRDGDELKDYLDDDDDGDRVVTLLEDRDGNGEPRNDDTDLDGTPDYLDADDDGDGLWGAFEGGGDSDGDGVADAVDSDDDGDGIATREERPDANKDGDPADARDSDGDGTSDFLDSDDDGDTVGSRHERELGSDQDLDKDRAPDHLDADDDGDGLPSASEAPDPNGDGVPADARDTDNDGTPDYLDGDDDGDGRGTADEIGDVAARAGASDLDGDGLANWLDTDSDGDVAPDELENLGGGDLNRDSVPDYLDPRFTLQDSDRDGISDAIECPTGASCPDHDGDGEADRVDDDDDDDGVATLEERPNGVDVDTDGDRLADHLDSDDDGDGIPTATEATVGSSDADGDGVPNRLDRDSDDDGISDDAESSYSDGDGDGVPDFIDPSRALDDPDGDGVGAELECGGARDCPDTDEDGIPDDEDSDDDNDGLPTSQERPQGVAIDSDRDERPNHLDPDDDGDGVPTERELTEGDGLDQDGDGIPNHLDTDDDNDTLTTRKEGTGGRGRDSDGDSLRNYLDADDDGDGIATELELEHSAVYGADRDRDGVPSYLDKDSDGDGLTDQEEGGEDAIADGVPDYLRAGGIAGGSALCSGSPVPAQPSGAACGASLILGAGVWVRRRRRRSYSEGQPKSEARGMREGVIPVSRNRDSYMRVCVVAALSAALSGWGCTERSPGAAAATRDRGSACSDHDGDGFGEGCADGHDCDDGDSNVHEGCLHCATPQQGCACTAGVPPVSCFLEKTIADDGTPMCHEGTRYCRDGSWSGCESIHSYPQPDRSGPTSLVDRDAAPTNCSDCNIKCFIVRDNLDPVDGGLNDSGDGVTWSAGGGLQLGTTTTIWEQPTNGTQDGGTVTGPTACMPGTAPDVDCDGIPDLYDPYPFQKPFASTNPAIFLNLAPGETGSGTIELVFIMNTLDVYFLLDQTDSMNSVRNKLHGALLEGTFLTPDVVCADTDLDGEPNDELKTQGVLGGIRCLLREAEVGVGFMREIPFSTYGGDDEITYQHVLDMTTDSQAAIDAVESFGIERDVDWPDAHPLALYALATGEGLYMGLNKPGVPPKVGCASERWGYACFRPDAIPVVLLFTDSPMHQGPPVPGRDFNYDPSRLTVTSGSQSSYSSVPPDNEDFSSQLELGEISDSYVTYAGNTATMSSEYTRSLMTCLASGRDAAPDATFSFALDAAQTVSFSTAGSGFETAVAVYNHLVDVAAEYVSTNTNETSVEALNLGEVADGWSRASGITTGMSADYAASAVGCSADDAAPDAVFKFSLAQPRSITIDSVGSAFDSVISLHTTAPALPTAVPATNVDEASAALAVNLGDVYQRIYNVTGGNTSGMAANYTESQLGCSADTASADAVYRFALSQATRVRINAIGSGFDTVIGLADGALGGKQPLAVTGGDLQEAPIELGDLVHAWYGLSGTTAGLMPNYRQAFVGCNAETFSPDAVVHFNLTQPTRVRFNTTGSAFDTVLSLHDGDIDPTTPLATTNQNETASAPMVLGTVDDAWFEIFGGNTSTMSADYDGNIAGCGADSFSRDAVFAFNVVSNTRVRMDTLGSTFDTVISLFDGPPPINTHVSVTATDSAPIDIGTIDDTSRVYYGTTAGLAADYGGAGMGCNTEETPADVAFKFHVDTATEVEINTEESAFDTAIGLFPSVIRDPLKPTASTVDNLNEAKASAKDAGLLDGKWNVYSGSTTSMSSNMSGYCGAPNNSRDAVFKFTLAAPATMRLSTSGSAVDTVMALYNHATDALIDCNDNGAGGTAALITQSLAGGTYYVVIKGARSNDKGAYTLSMRDIGLTNPISCNDDAFVSGRSRIIAQLLPGDYHLVLKGARAGHEGAFAVRFRDNEWWSVTNRLACNDDVGTRYVSEIERDLTPGTYYLVLKGDLAVDQGPFMLTVRSISSGATTSHTLACNDNLGGSSTASQVEYDLAAGEYWAVVKGKSSSGAPYQLEVRDIGASGQGLVLACDDDSGGGNASQIERDLAAGSYYIFVKGDGSSDSGAYQLSVRDVTNTGGTALACDDDSGGSGAARIQRSLAAGDYWVVLKGDAATDKGAYALSVRDLASSTRTQYGCSTASSGTFALGARRYDLVLKGKDNDQAGGYALTLGNGVTQQTTFTPPDWNETLNALQDREMRVITVLNCHDNGLHGEGRDCDIARQQAEDVADATDALGPNLEKLVIDIDANGTGIETAIMTQLQLLSGHLEMDVSARVVFEPDLNPGFIVSVLAIDRPGDGCDGLVGTEHQNCRPGATPRFVINITNPLDSPVPLNPNDPNGGYNFRADLIADRKYFVDAVPIYVIPEDVDDNVPEPIYTLESMGEYWQDIASPGCIANERPEWEHLSWTADVPDGSSVTFSACTGENQGALTSCTLAHIATVTGFGSCTSDSQCSGGFCAGNGVCQVIHGGACASDIGCTSNAICDTSVGKCRFSGQPVHIGTVLGATNLYTNLRMNIVLRANTMTNQGPTVHDWSATYMCRNVN